MKKNILYVMFCLLASSILVAACRLSVSLTGSNIDPRAKTVYVGTFTNTASLVNPTLSQDVTTSLKEQIQNQTPLTIVNSQSADYRLEGEITGYTVMPIAIQGNDVAAMNRLTITVRVRFFNKYNENDNFEQTFSRYIDYPSAKSFSSVESSLVAEINVALTEDIFNKAFVNW